MNRIQKQIARRTGSLKHTLTRILLAGCIILTGALGLTEPADAQCFIRIGSGSIEESYHAVSTATQGFRQGFKSGNTNMFEDFKYMIVGTFTGDPRAMIQAFGLLNPASYVKWGAAGFAANAAFGISMPGEVDVYDALTGYSPGTPHHIQMNDKISGIAVHSITAGACDDAQILFYRDTDFTGPIYRWTYASSGHDGRVSITDSRVANDVSGFAVSFSSLQVKEIWPHGERQGGFVDIAVTGKV